MSGVRHGQAERLLGETWTLSSNSNIILIYEVDEVYEVDELNENVWIDGIK